MKSVSFRCTHCSEVLGPFAGEARPHSCTNCSETGPFKVDIAKTEYGNYQKITLQESPGSVPPGRVPRYKDVVLLGDLIDIARPGEEVEVTGVYRHAQGTYSVLPSLYSTYTLLIALICVYTLRFHLSPAGHQILVLMPRTKMDFQCSPLS